MSRLVLELKFAIRTVVRSRFISTLAVLAFALGIGVTTAVFSIFNAVLLRPLPYPRPMQIVSVYDTQPACATCPASWPKYHDWKARNQVFSAIGGSTQASFVMTGHGDPTRVAGASTTASLVEVFGVMPALGRWYSEQEDQPGGPKVVVLSHDFWTRRLNADAHIVGQTLTFDGQPYAVIGVMPQGFAHRRADVFVPIQRTVDPSKRGNHFLATYARLKDGVPIERATTEMRALGESLAREFGTNHGIDVKSYYETIVGGIRTPLRILLGAVLLVLLIACANVANLLLASGIARRRELGIRLALGAGTRDLARQLVTESLVLSAPGALVGVLLAQWAVRTFVFLAGTQLPRAATITLDGRVLAFTAAVSLVVGLVCGIWPLVMMRSKDLASAVREGDVRTGSAVGRRFGNSLVIGEIAVAFALLVGAGLLVKNLVLLRTRDAGIRTDRIVAFDVAPSGTRYRDEGQVTAFYRDLYARLAQLGTIESAGMTSHLPMYNFGWNGEFSIEGGNPWGPNDAPLVEYRWIHGDYFKTMGVPLLKGRALAPRGKNTFRHQYAMAESSGPGRIRSAALRRAPTRASGTRSSGSPATSVPSASPRSRRTSSTGRSSSRRFRR